MGMFDNVKYKGEVYQTKDTPHQLLYDYELRDDGTLWRECYTIIWHKDESSWLGIREERKDIYWKFEDDFDGVIRFYRSVGKGWVEYRALFMEGKLLKLERIE